MSAAAIRSTSARRFAPTTYENICNRCGQLVYSAEKIGPLKDFTFYHHNCFKCCICGSKLTLKTYYNNQQDQDDKEVYCQSHVPKTGPGHLDGQSVGIKQALNVPKKNHLINEQIRISGLNNKPPILGTDALIIKHGSIQDSNNLNLNKPHQYPPGHFDATALHIQHAVNQTKLNRSAVGQQLRSNNGGPGRPGIESRINEFLDSETQRKLEMLHRDEEDALYRQFSKKRQEEVSNINIEIKEEWEKELEKLTNRFLLEIKNSNSNNNKNSNKKYSNSINDYVDDIDPTTKALTLKHQKEKEDLEKNMTIKLDRKKESITKKLLEQERQATAELVEKQSKEMMNLITAKLQEFSLNQNGFNNKNHSTNSKDLRNKTNHLNELDQTSLDDRQNLIDSSYPQHPPPPIYSSITKLDIYNDPNVFAELDQIAINVAREDQKTFTDLVRQLTATCVTDVEKARVIFRWITAKNLNTIKFDDNISADTPMGILRGIKHGTESYHVLFKRLCSYVGLHCVVIKGYSKSAGYQPGVHFEDSRFRNSWNAVYVAGKWNFVQCNWSARHLVNAKEISRTGTGSGSNSHHHHHHHHSGSSTSTSSSSSSSPSSSKNPSTTTTTDSLRYEYDDHYFLTDPKEFIYEFFPLQPEWQLLRCPISLREFEELPFVRSLFFRYGLYFVDEDIQAILRTDSSGAVTVRIGMPSYMTPSLIFHYNLKLIDDNLNLNYPNGSRRLPADNSNNNGGLDQFDGVVLKRFVMQSVSGNIVTFRVHAPCPGAFIMDIFANSTTPKEYITGEPMKFKSVCKFKIVCDELRTVMVPLPDCASGEWGPLKATRLFGLIPLTHLEALIFSPGKDLEIQFRMSRPLTDFMASLHKNGFDERKLSRFVTILVNNEDHNNYDDLVTIRILFPEEGQYGLDIYTREENLNFQQQHQQEFHSNSNSNLDSNKQQQQQLLTHCCKYLINVSFSKK